MPFRVQTSHILVACWLVMISITYENISYKAFRSLGSLQKMLVRLQCNLCFASVGRLHRSIPSRSIIFRIFLATNVHCILYLFQWLLAIHLPRQSATGQGPRSRTSLGPSNHQNSQLNDVPWSQSGQEQRPKPRQGGKGRQQSSYFLCFLNKQGHNE